MYFRAKDNDILEAILAWITLFCIHDLHLHTDLPQAMLV